MCYPPCTFLWISENLEHFSDYNSIWFLKKSNQMNISLKIDKVYYDALTMETYPSEVCYLPVANIGVGD